MKQINLVLIATFLCLTFGLFWVEQKSESKSVLLNNVCALSEVKNASNKIDLLHLLVTIFKLSGEPTAPPNARMICDSSKLVFDKTESLISLLEKEKYTVADQKRGLNDLVKQRLLEYGFLLWKSRFDRDTLFYNFSDSLKKVYESSDTKEYKVLILSHLQNRIFTSGYEYLRDLKNKIGYWEKSLTFLPDTVLYKPLDWSVGKVSVYNEEYGKKDEKIKVKIELLPELRNYFNSSLYAYHKGIVVDTSDYQKFIVVKLTTNSDKFTATEFNAEKQYVNDFVIPDWNFEVVPKVAGRIFLKFEIQAGFLTRDKKELLGKPETFKYSIIVK